MVEHDLSRRQMLLRAAAAATALGLAVSINVASRKAEAKINPSPDPEADNTILNTLLTGEYDAVATYTAGASLIALDTGTAQATRDVVTSVALHFQDQHKQHASALEKLITDNGGTPATDTKVAKLPTSFPAAATTTDVMKLAADKEKHAAIAYAQVMQNLSTQVAAKLVASIGGVETQHFVVLYLLIEGLISTNDSTKMNPSLIVPAAFVLNTGVTGNTNLENFPALDTLLTLDPA
ncbi:MAG TPA: ferritin-like domain-containing protein [Polyangiaceae bacterium]|nr:ferritin-like domain-containing protein [Polyangiaceae bacterium]